MKRILTLFSLAVCVAAYAMAITPHEAWTKLYPQIEKQIKAPTFPDRDFVITDYGTRSETPGFLYTELINSTIDRCSAAGGGRVVIPAGIWLTGPITLKSNVNLHLSEGATLLFTPDLKDYPLVLTRWEGVDCYNYQPMVYAYKQKNIAVTGKGTLDGGASNDNWWAMCGAPHFGYDADKDMISQRIGRPTLLQWNEHRTPVEFRRMGDGYGMRVQLVNPMECENVLIEDITLLRAPFWVIHPAMCDNVTVRGVKVFNEGPNGDGCDPESCKNVLIEGCHFSTGDDCIAIKSGRNADGRAGRPAENIIVRNCKMENGHGGVVIGSEIAGGFRNLFVENCQMDSPDLDRVIRIKTSNCRGGVIEDIFVRNITVGQCREAVLKINLNYDPKEKCQRDFPPVVRNVFMQNVTCEGSKFGIKIDALDDVCNVNDIRVEDCVFSGVETGANDINGKTSNVTWENLVINGKKK